MQKWDIIALNSTSLNFGIMQLRRNNMALQKRSSDWLDAYRTLAYVSSSSATIQAMSAKVGTIGPSIGRREGRPGSS